MTQALRIAKGAGAHAGDADRRARGRSVRAGRRYQRRWSTAARRLHVADVAWAGRRRCGNWAMANRRAAVLPLRRGGAHAANPVQGILLGWPRSQRAGNAPEANRYFDLAAAYPDRFYGQLALEQAGPRHAAAECQERRSAQRRQQTACLRQRPADAGRARSVARRTVAHRHPVLSRDRAERRYARPNICWSRELARETGRRDLAVNVAEAAGADGLDQFVAQGFPDIADPARRELDDGPCDRAAGKPVRRRTPSAMPARAA